MITIWAYFLIQSMKEMFFSFFFRKTTKNSGLCSKISPSNCLNSISPSIVSLHGTVLSHFAIKRTTWCNIHISSSWFDRIENGFLSFEEEIIWSLHQKREEDGEEVEAYSTSCQRKDRQSFMTSIPKCILNGIIFHSFLSFSFLSFIQIDF